jgi:hypothetical protein
MNLLFDLQGSGRASGGLLVCEWGAGYCCAALLDGDSLLLHRLRYWTLDMPLSSTDRDQVLEFIRPLSAHAARTVFCSGFPDAVLVPQRFATSGAEIISELFPAAGEAWQDQVGAWQLSATYAFPPSLHKQLTSQFPAAEYFHAFSASLKTSNGIDAPSQVQVHFAPGQVRVLARKNGFLQLAQVYRYESPLDVVYYLLRILETTGLSRSETPLVLSGLIEGQSSLYRELHQFFTTVFFASAPGAIAEEGRPAHFFTSLFNLAQCVS